MEVRRQFAEIPGLREGTAEADSDKCVAISTQSSVEEMILPGIYAILAPITVGFLVGPRCLTGLLGGAIASGMMLAIMMANAGGAWDNSKKYIEIEGACGGKGTETHKACVVGDTVGDPVSAPPPGRRQTHLLTILIPPHKNMNSSKIPVDLL